jgi:hypothetical protein
MSAVVIAPYKVKPEKREEFLEILREKRKYFLKAGYITKRPALLLQSKLENEFYLEIFEWKSEVDSLNAHEDATVIAFWEKMENLWEDGGFALSHIPEAGLPFPHYEPVDIYEESDEI